MKSYLLLIAIALLAGCSTAYKSGQTPDDVYFSPDKPVANEEYVRMEKRDERKYNYNEEDYYDDSYVRMKLRNRLYYVLDDPWYRYDPYYRHNNSYYSYSSSYNHAYWNYFYNPYGRQYVVIDASPKGYNKPRTYNLHVFDRENSKNPSIPKGYRGSTTSYRDNNENYRGSGSNAGDYLRGVFNGNSSGSGSKTYSPPPSGSSGSSGSSSGNSSSGSDSKPARGNATRGN